MGRTLNAEWIPYMDAYRLYDPKYPQQTVAYEEDASEAEEHAIENGYAGIVVIDPN